MMKPLNNTTTQRTLRPVKILQFGEGNFLRAFVDWMIEKANKSGILNHGVAVVQPIRGGEEIASVFQNQDHLYHVYLEGIKNKQPVKEITRVECINALLNPYTQYDAYERLFLQEELEMIISNTTEAGIRYVEGDDLTASPPDSFPAKMTALLYKRYQKYKGAPDKGLLIICCELIEDNGSVLRAYVLRHAQQNRLEQGFITWIERSCHFYDTLVDRIVSGFPKENSDEIKKELGFDDHLLVKGEYFHVWAIGGDPVIRERFPLDKAGLNVLFMDDIRDFRARKVRILNGSHTAMVPIALQLGCQTVKEAFGIPEVEAFITRMVETEVLPVIAGDQEELRQFAAEILERFYNPFLHHYLKDISLNALAKWETRNYPTIWDNAKCNQKARFNRFAFAALLVLYAGHSKAIDFVPNDVAEHITFIRQTFQRNNLRAWVTGIVTNKDIWRENITQIPDFIEDVSDTIEQILTLGMENALKEVLL
ncbi:tagaturonate reductase [Parabacteroides sp. PF5-9]|uniref:tagaturonate reductase n=1 Tax=Parabacteroides sp. PF5-9 TaxID=1742404 RepID=UPI0024740C37|nr:tagaturonate reductase [Parabacteroides sp. PF5-9]MDH6356384.1 tagaturonate reductase [Parabacteroides sp. PF5-9]